MSIQGGPHSTLDIILASHPAAPGSNPGIPEFFSEKYFFPEKKLLMLPRLIDSAAA